jgi:iron-sulfur cluster assembly protein
MALDEPKENDEVHEFDDYKFVVEKDLQEKAQPIKVDFTGFGFKIDCHMEFGQAESSCSGCSSESGSCG